MLPKSTILLYPSLHWKVSSQGLPSCPHQTGTRDFSPERVTLTTKSLHHPVEFYSLPAFLLSIERVTKQTASHHKCVPDAHQLFHYKRNFVSLFTALSWP